MNHAQQEQEHELGKKKSSSAGCIYFIKNTKKTGIFRKIIIIKINVFYANIL